MIESVHQFVAAPWQNGHRLCRRIGSEIGQRKLFRQVVDRRHVTAEVENASANNPIGIRFSSTPRANRAPSPLAARSRKPSRPARLASLSSLAMPAACAASAFVLQFAGRLKGTDAKARDALAASAGRASSNELDAHPASRFSYNFSEEKTCWLDRVVIQSDGNAKQKRLQLHLVGQSLRPEGLRGPGVREHVSRARLWLFVPPIAVAGSVRLSIAARPICCRTCRAALAIGVPASDFTSCA